MQETIGVLDLKIARLQRRLKLIEQQQSLSQAYPFHHAKLMRQGSLIHRQLQQLVQRRAGLVTYFPHFLAERPCYDEFDQRL